MAMNDGMFTPETVDEQIEDMLRDLRTQRGQQRQMADLDMFRDLTRAYQSNEEAEMRALEHGWQRLRQTRHASRLLDQQREGLHSPGSLSFPPIAAQHAGHTISPPVKQYTLQYRLGIVAVLAMLVLLAGSLAMLLNAIHQPQSLAPVSSQSGVYIVDFDVVYKLDIKTGAEHWHHQLANDGQKLYLVGNSLYVSTHTGIEALNTTNGALRWQRALQGIGNLWISDGFIYVEDGMENAHPGYKNLYRLSASNGAPLWSHAQTGGLIIGAAHGLVYVNSIGNVLSALDAANGHMRWQRQEAGDFAWRTEPFSIVLVEDTIYDASVNTLYAFNALDGTVRWQKRGQPGQVMTLPRVADGIVYVNSLPSTPSTTAHSKVYVSAYAAQTGTNLWTSDKGENLYFSLQPTNDVVFVYATRSNIMGIYALDSHNGKVRWRYNTGSCSTDNTCTQTGIALAAADNILYIFHTLDTHHGVLLAVNIATNATRWSRPANYSLIDFSPAVSNGMLYLVEHSSGGPSRNILHTYKVTDGSERWTHQFGLRPMGEDQISSDAMVIVP